MSMDAEDVIMTLSKHAFFGSKFARVDDLADCKVMVVRSSSDEEPSPEEAKNYSELKGARKLRAFATPGMNLFVRILLPPPPSPGKHQ